MVLWFYAQELPKAQLAVVLVLKRLRRSFERKFTKKQKKKKKTPTVKFLDLIFRNNFFIFNFSKMCSR